MTDQEVRPDRRSAPRTVLQTRDGVVLVVGLVLVTRDSSPATPTGTKSRSASRSSAASTPRSPRLATSE